MKKILPLMILFVLLGVIIVGSLPGDPIYPWVGKWVNETGGPIPDGVGIEIYQEIIKNSTTKEYCECASTSDDFDYNETDGSWGTTTDRADFFYTGAGNYSICFALSGSSCQSDLHTGFYTYAITTNATFYGFEEGFAEPFLAAFTNSSCTFNNGTLIINNPPNITGIPDNWTWEDTIPPWTIDLCNYTTDDRDNCTDLVFSVIVDNTTLINAFVFDGHYLNFTQPGANLSGSTSVTVTATDTGGLSDNDTFIMTVIPVNDPPYLQDFVLNVNEDTTPPKNWSNLLTNSGDIDNSSDELIFSFVNQTNASLINCEVVISGNVYFLNCSTPAPNQTGTNYVTINVSDGELWDIGIATVNVNPINDPPVIDGIPDNWTWEDTAPPWEIDLWLYASDTEDPVNAMTYTVIAQTNASLISCSVRANRYLNCSTPAANLTGYSDVMVRVTDTGGKSDNDTMRVTVLPVNDPPYLQDFVLNVNEDTTPPKNWSNLLTNSGDIDNSSDELIFSFVNQTNASLINCEVVISGNVYFLNCSTPAPNQTGTNYVTINVSDGELWDIGIATVNVNPINDPPVIDGIPDNWTWEDTAPPWEIDLWLYASDTEDPVNAMTYTVIAQTNSSLINCFVRVNRYLNCSTPALNLVGQSNVTVQVMDTGGLTDNDTMTVTVVPVNDPPNIDDANTTVLLNTPRTFNLITLMNYFDVDINDTHNFTLESTVPNGTNFTITDSINGIVDFIGYQVGIYNFTIKVTDSGNLSDTAIFTIEVISMDVIVVKTIEATGENQYITTVTVYNYNNESQDFYNLTLIDSELGINMTFDLLYRGSVEFKNNVTLAGAGITAFTVAEVQNPSLGTVYYSNEESVWITDCPACPGPPGGGGKKCPPIPPCEPTECPESPECPPSSDCEDCEDCEQPSPSDCGSGCDEIFNCLAKTDNGFTFQAIEKIVECNGNVVYRFKVINSNNHALSYVAIGLPDAIWPEDGSVYSGRFNDYNVENPTNNPFYSIKFETIGEGIKESGYDIFEVTLPYNPGNYDIRIEAKAGQRIGTVVLNCKGETCLPCGLVGQAFKFVEFDWFLWPLLLLLLLLLPRPKVLVVDTRNTFRSLFTKYMLKKEFRKDSFLHFIFGIVSCGTHALNGKKPSKWIKEFAKLKKVEMGWDRTRAITEKMVKWAYKIVVMKSEHKRFIVKYALQLRPKNEIEGDIRFLRIKLERMKKKTDVNQQVVKNMFKKIRTLKKELEKIEKLERKIWVLGIEDPVGKDVSVYKKCFDVIKKKCKNEELLNWLRIFKQEEEEKNGRKKLQTGVKGKGYRK